MGLIPPLITIMNQYQLMFVGPSLIKSAFWEIYLVLNQKNTIDFSQIVEYYNFKKYIFELLPNMSFSFIKTYVDVVIQLIMFISNKVNKNKFLDS